MHGKSSLPKDIWKQRFDELMERYPSIVAFMLNKDQKMLKLQLIRWFITPIQELSDKSPLESIKEIGEQATLIRISDHYNKK